MATLSGFAQTTPAGKQAQPPVPWPPEVLAAQQLQAEAAKALGSPAERQISLGDGVKMTFVLVPAGESMMGAPASDALQEPDEAPQTKVRIEHPFWMEKYEVSNQQYHCFDPVHDSRHIDTHWKDRVGPGNPVNDDLQPVCRISWLQAMDFCRWLTGKCKGALPGAQAAEFRLPTEAEWEYACRAGSATPWYFGATDDLIAKYANYADKDLARNKPWAVRDDRFSDGAIVSARLGQYLPNGFGLFDMHGNVAEWCLSLHKPYPYRADDERDDISAKGSRVVRGGSWDDPPRRVRSSFRQNYAPDYRVYNVGFRVVCPVK
jgi:formylglycine-generating enzyme required for sulfatase activity